MNAILIPGRPDKEQYYSPLLPTNSNDFWFPWLTKQLMLEDILTVSIEVPHPYSPRYDVWKKEFERFEIHADTILVGHSCGGGFLIRYLSEHPNLQVGKVVLVAPWINPMNNPVSDTADFFDFDIDPGLVARTHGVTVFVSQDDDASVLQTVDIIREKIANLDIREFTNRGHFTFKDSEFVEFPELLRVLVSHD